MARGLNRFQVGLQVQRFVDDADGIEQPAAGQQRGHGAPGGPQFGGAGGDQLRGGHQPAIRFARFDFQHTAAVGTAQTKDQ